MKRKANEIDDIEERRMKRKLLCSRLEQSAEYSINKAEVAKLKAFGEEVMKAIREIPSDKETGNLFDVSFLEKYGLEFPFKLPFEVDLKKVKSPCGFRYLPPERMSYLWEWRDTCAVNDFTEKRMLDLNVIMPQKCFGSRDYLNFTYFVKRAYYMSCLAVALYEKNFNLCFKTEDVDRLRPMLMCRKEDIGVIRIFCSPSEEFIKLSRLRPENNNLRPSFCNFPGDLADDIPTPCYSNMIAEDMLRQKLSTTLSAFYKGKSVLIKAVVIAEIWLGSYGFRTRRGRFSYVLLAAWFKYICDEGQFGEHYLVVDYLSAFFTSLVTVNWKTKPLSLSADVNIDLHSQFEKYYEYTFTDETGYWNLSASLDSTTMAEMKSAASFALKQLNTLDIARLTGKIPLDFPIKYDYLIRMSISDSFLKELLEKSPSSDRVIFFDSCGDYVSVFLKKTASILERAWKDRVSNFRFHTPEMAENDNETLVFIGVNFMQDWNNPVTRGPPAQSKEAKDFTAFWGNICELRKYPDNAICESIVWSKGNLSFCVPHLICQHVLYRHLNLSPRFVQPSFQGIPMQPRAEARYDAIWLAYEKLTNFLRFLEGLPLSVASIAPVSPFLRRTDPFPPESTEMMIDKTSQVHELIAIPNTKTSPPYLPAVEVQLTMEYSGKWGQNLEAINHLKTAFYIKLAELLVKKHSVRSYPFKEHLIVQLDGTLFRLIIVHPREVHLMKKSAQEGHLLKDTPESKARELEYFLKPQLAAYLHSVSRQYAAYAETCRVIKRWLSAHRCADLIHPMIVETIVASVFIKPFTFTPPKTSFAGFFQTLLLFAKHDWVRQPIFVDFNNGWTDDDVEEIYQKFVKTRTTLPALVVCSPADLTGIAWTRKQPEPVTLKYICDIARECESIYVDNINKGIIDLKSLFFDSGIYNFQIVLNNEHVVKKEGNVVSGNRFRRKKRDVLPVYDYDPVEKYVDILRQNYASSAVFLYDKYCGNVINVAWQPEAATPKRTNISSCLHRYKTGNDELRLNKKAILEDFKLLGYGLVLDVASDDD